MCMPIMNEFFMYIHKVYLSMRGSIFRIFDPWCQDRRSVFRVRRVKVSVFTDHRDGFPGGVQESPKSKLILWCRLKRIFGKYMYKRAKILEALYIDNHRSITEKNNI